MLFNPATADRNRAFPDRMARLVPEFIMSAAIVRVDESVSRAQVQVGEEVDAELAIRARARCSP